MPATVIRHGKTVQLYLDIAYLPLLDADNAIQGIISFSYDVTDAFAAKLKVQETADRLQQAYDDLEVKVKFRNLELERINFELQRKLDDYSK